MKKFAKRTTAIVSSILMTSALTFSALNVSADETPKSPVTLEQASVSVNFDITKDIVLFNSEGEKIYEPNVTYTYSVSPAAVDKATISAYDNSDPAIKITNKVRAGIDGAVTLTGNDTENPSTLVFGKSTDKTESNQDGDNVEVTTDSKTASQSLNIAIDADKIYANGANQPGVYRYKISDVTNAATLEAAGIERNEKYDEDLYLDVYTKYNADKDGLVIYGYVLYKEMNAAGNGSNPDRSFDSDDDATGENDTVKVSGYDVESEHEIEKEEPTEEGGEPTYKPGDIISDQYHTYNVEVKKVTDGELADITHKFPFQLELSNEKVTSAQDFYYKESFVETPTDSILTGGAWDTANVDALKELALKNGESIKLTGLPVGTKIKVTETNDTADLYTASISVNGTAGEATQVAAGSTKALDSTDVEKNTDADEIIFTNTLKEISVTGLIFKFAPFIAMLAFGGVMIVLFARNKKRGETDNMI